MRLNLETIAKPNGLHFKLNELIVIIRDGHICAKPNGLNFKLNELIAIIN